MLKNIPLKAVYRSETDDLLSDFYIPCLTEAIAYDRAVGFFSAGMLSIAAQGISAIVEKKGRIRLIFACATDQQTTDAIKTGYALKEISEIEGNRIIGEIDNITDALTNRRLEVLSWLVAYGLLEIKLAIKEKGMYHEKIGIFVDEEGNKVVFQGSANETPNALLPDFNFESINVFAGWRTELYEYYQPYVEGFEKLWEDKAQNTRVISFPEAAKHRLIKIAESVKRPSIGEEIRLCNIKERSNPDAEQQTNPRYPVYEDGQVFELRSHQRAALKSWQENNFIGIFEMATGSGKTKTAIAALVRLFENTPRLCAIVAVPYQSLADQWIDELSEFGVTAIPCYGGKDLWESRLSSYVDLYRLGSMRFFSAVVVNKTLCSESFQKELLRIPGKGLLWIGDECHHHSSAAIINSLPRHSQFRMGLSATPFGEYDEERNNSLSIFYGNVIYKYDLEKALQDSVLTPYEYNLIPVLLTEEESNLYVELSTKIKKLTVLSESDDEFNESVLKTLLMKRARLIGSASNKILALESLLRKIPVSPYTLVYCGDGTMETDDSESHGRQLEVVGSVLSKMKWRISPFTSSESRDQRALILSRFRSASIHALVAIRCLDEGIDVPNCKTAIILASSKNSRQFIQRRGRILRKSPGKDYAVIYDFLTLLPSTFSSDIDDEKKLFMSELKRVNEFARLSRNYADTYKVIEGYLDQYGAHHKLG